MKQGLKKVTKGSIRSHLARILKAYRLTPHATTGVSPSELLLGHWPKSRLDLLKPMTADRVEAKQLKQKQQHDASAVDRSFKEGDRVFVKNFQSGEKWLPGVIVKKRGPVSFRVRLSDGQERRCHQDQIRSRTVNVTLEPTIETETPPASSEQEPSPLSTPPESEPEVTTEPVHRYPSRTRTAVQRYDPSW